MSEDGATQSDYIQRVQAPDNLLIGRKIGGYEIRRKLGEGGMATVYVAQQPAMQRDVAIKMIRQELSQRDPMFITRFEREAQVLATLEHIHILPVIDFGQDGDYVYLVMRLLDKSLAQYLTERYPLPLEEVGRLLDQIATALDYAHEHGVIHRDLKPHNVLLDNQLNCFLADFGIARLADSESKLTSTGAIIGTPAYISPEQVMGERATAASDCYSLGVMLYEMISGKLPFQGETALTTATQRLHQPPAPIAQYRDDLPESCQALITQALSVNPGQRYPTARALAEAFRSTIAGTTGAAVPAAPRSADTHDDELPTVIGLEDEGLISKSVLSVPDGVPAPATQQLEQKSSNPSITRRPAWKIAIAAVVLLLILAVGGSLILSRSTPGPSAAALNDLGFEALQKLDYTTAIRYFKEAIQADPGYAAAHYNLGVAYDEQGDLTNGRTAYQAALDRDDRLLMARYRLSDLLLDAKDVTAAFPIVDLGVRQLKLADLKLSKEDQKRLTFLLYTTRGRAYLMRSTPADLALAETDLQQALAFKEAVPYPAPAYYYLAQVYEGQGKTDDARLAWENTLAYHDQTSARQREWAVQASEKLGSK